VEGGLRDAPLPLPELSLRGEQSVAEHVAQGRIAARLLAVVLVVLGEDVVHARRRADQVRDHRAEAEADHLPVIAEGLQEELDRIAPRLGQAPQQRMTARPGRRLSCSEIEDVRERHHEVVLGA